MSEALSLAHGAIDDQYSNRPAATRRQLVAGATATLGSMGLLSMVPSVADAAHSEDPQTILNVAATAEVLATIVNTVALERPGLITDAVTRQNLAAAAREELIHYEFLTSSAAGGKEVTKTIYVPNAVFADRVSLLQTLVVGDQIFCNAYLIGTTVFGNNGNGQLARITAEIMGTEAVHRALARQSLGQLGNDRAYIKYSQGEDAVSASNPRQPGFRRILTAVAQLEAAGFGFGKPGSVPGTAFNFDEVRTRTPNPTDVVTRTPR